MPRIIVERSDFDKHQDIDKEELGEDWGDGFFVNPEPVLIERGPQGEIVRTTNLSEVTQQQQEEVIEPLIAAPSAAPVQMVRSEREKLVEILATRMFKWYEEMGRSNTKLNPLFDGIPTCSDHPLGCALECARQTGRYHATKGEVYDWMKNIVAARVQIINRKQRQVGWEMDANDAVLRITRKPTLR